MITRRDLIVALIAVVSTVGAFAAADELPLIGSSVSRLEFDSGQTDGNRFGAIFLHSAYADAGAPGGARHHT